MLDVSESFQCQYFVSLWGPKGILIFLKSDDLVFPLQDTVGQVRRQMRSTAQFPGIGRRLGLRGRFTQDK